MTTLKLQCGSPASTALASSQGCPERSRQLICTRLPDSPPPKPRLCSPSTKALPHPASSIPHTCKIKHSCPSSATKQTLDLTHVAERSQNRGSAASRGLTFHRPPRDFGDGGESWTWNATRRTAGEGKERPSSSSRRTTLFKVAYAPRKPCEGGGLEVLEVCTEGRV